MWVRGWPESRDTGDAVSTNPIILPFLSQFGFRASFPAVMNERCAPFAFASRTNRFSHVEYLIPSLPSFSRIAIQFRNKCERSIFLIFNRTFRRVKLSKGRERKNQCQRSSSHWDTRWIRLRSYLTLHTLWLFLALKLLVEFAHARSAHTRSRDRTFDLRTPSILSCSSLSGARSIL